MARHLTMSFQRQRDGRDIGMGCANGTQVRYEVRQIGRACWVAEIATSAWTKRAWVVQRLRECPSRKSARHYCQRDFVRRQLLREVA